MQITTRAALAAVAISALFVVFSAPAQAQGAEPTDPCSEEAVVEWRKAADRAAKESAASAQETIDSDPGSPAGRIESSGRGDQGESRHLFGRYGGET